MFCPDNSPAISVPANCCSVISIVAFKEIVVVVDVLVDVDVEVEDEVV